jgi:hypothetical protein
MEFFKEKVNSKMCKGENGEGTNSTGTKGDSGTESTDTKGDEK